MSEQIREILIAEQDHQIALATALGKNVRAPDSDRLRFMSRPNCSISLALSDVRTFFASTVGIPPCRHAAKINNLLGDN
jgi:hypothetical protein